MAVGRKGKRARETMARAAKRARRSGDGGGNVWNLGLGLCTVVCRLVSQLSTKSCGIGYFSIQKERFLLWHVFCFTEKQGHLHVESFSFRWRIVRFRPFFQKHQSSIFTMKIRSLLPMFVCFVFAATLMVLQAQESTNTVAAAAESVSEAVSAVPEGAVAEDEEVTWGRQWAAYIRQGGTTMIFIGLLSVLGVGCALERFWNLRRGRIVPDGFASDVIRLWNENSFEGVRDVCAKSRSMLARVVETMLEHKDSKDAQEVKMFAEDKAGRELRLENRKSAMLATVSTISPLLGLFGTVVGLLGAFGTVAAMGEMGDASVLADDIGKALVTTVAGLAVSMPALFVYQILKNRLALYAVELEEQVADLVNKIFVERR